MNIDVTIEKYESDLAALKRAREIMREYSGRETPLPAATRDIQRELAVDTLARMEPKDVGGNQFTKKVSALNKLEATDENRTQFGAWIREQREALSLTRAELGADLGVGNTAVRNWERGEIDPEGERADEIRAFFAQAQPAPEPKPVASSKPSAEKAANLLINAYSAIHNLKEHALKIPYARCLITSAMNVLLYSKEDIAEALGTSVESVSSDLKYNPRTIQYQTDRTNLIKEAGL